MSALAALMPSRAVLSRPLLACFGITAALHLGTVLLNTLLPLHVTAQGGTKTQVGLLFSVATLVGMFLRPAIGGWVDRYGAPGLIGPGALLLLVTSLAFQRAETPSAVIALMIGVGVSSSLISTPASVHAAAVSSLAHRGEALGTYYLFSSLPTVIAAPLALALFHLGGIALGFLVVSTMAVAVGALTLGLRSQTRAPAAIGRSGPRLWSRHALSLSGVLVLTTCGHSAIYGFVPLAAIVAGYGAALPWFFGVYSVWLILCRALLRALSDRVGRQQVLVPAMAMLVVGYACLALPLTPLTLIVAAFCLGSGGSLFYPTLIALVADRTPPAERGLAIGTISGAWDLGIVIGSAGLGVIVERAGFGPGFIAGALTAAAGMVVFLVSEHRRRRIPGASEATVGGGWGRA